MNFYEGMYILDSSLSDDRIEELISNITGELQEKGAVIAVDRVGRKSLAHPVGRATEGFYVVIYFSSDPSLIQVLQGKYKLNSEIVRVMMLRRKDSEIARIQEKFAPKPEPEPVAEAAGEETGSSEETQPATAAQEPEAQEDSPAAPEAAPEESPATEEEQEKSE